VQSTIPQLIDADRFARAAKTTRQEHPGNGGSDEKDDHKKYGVLSLHGSQPPSSIVHTRP